jgi:hypothetical protein
MYSVLDGYNNKIPEAIISHPANCQIIPQIENVKKGSKSSITIEELYQRIKEWNVKYAVIEKV